MADSIAADRWVHTFGCGHATIPVEEMYPRIGGFVGFHPIIELPLTFFTRITGEMGVHQFLFLEREEYVMPSTTTKATTSVAGTTRKRAPRLPR